MYDFNFPFRTMLALAAFGFTSACGLLIYLIVKLAAHVAFV